MAGSWNCWKRLWKRAVLGVWRTARPIGRKWDKPPDGPARKSSIGPRRPARACGSIPWASVFGNIWERWAAAEVRHESEPGSVAFGAGDFCVFVFQPLDRVLAEKVAGTKAAGSKRAGSRRFCARLPEEEPEEACSREILPTDFFVAGHALVFDFSAVKLRSDAGGSGGEPAGGRSGSWWDVARAVAWS